jgi:pyruvate formate lyase activating enzyme
MLDWPGRIAATVFVSGCPFRCPYCHNPDLISATTAGDAAPIIELLAARRGWLDGIVITGGEPTADSGLIDFVAAVRETGLPVKLDTNGSNPEVLASILSGGLVEMVALDIKTVPERYDALTGAHGSAQTVAESVRLIIESGVRHEFRTTAWPGALTIADFPRIAAAIADGERYVIQQFRPERTLDPTAADVLPFSPDALRRAATLCQEHVPTTVRGVG